MKSKKICLILDVGSITTSVSNITAWKLPGTYRHFMVLACQAINELQWEILPHSAHPPDVAQCDHHLFSSLENSLEKQQFQAEGVKNDR